MAAFKIATYNVNSIRSRLHIIIPWLRKNHPDVFCMQETKVDDDRFPAGEFEGIGYHVVFKGERQYNGVATPPLADRSLNCIIDMDVRRAEKPSDHTILVAEFDKGEEGNE